MENIKTFTDRRTEFEITAFNNNKEMEFSLSTDTGDCISVWLSPNKVNELITHLAQNLVSICEPVELLDNK